MKTIVISECSNGWIIKPFWYQDPNTKYEDIAVFTDMAAMQEALPGFFGKDKEPFPELCNRGQPTK